MLGSRGLAPLGPFLGARAGRQVKYAGVTGSGAWHPLTHFLGAIRGVPAPQIVGKAEVIQLVCIAMVKFVVYQCHRLWGKRR